MQYSREISENGIEYEFGSVYERLGKLTDVRKNKGKRYSLTTIMMIILMAKLSGEDTVIGVAEWAKNRKTELIEILGLKRKTMPNHNTYRRMLANVIYQEEIERLVGEHNQQGAQGTIYAIDGKAIRGVRRKDETTSEYVLSVYDVEQGKVMSQVEVGRKENEISKASAALKLVNMRGKVLTGDAMHTQKRLSAQVLEGQGDFVLPVKENQEKLYKNIQSLFAPEYPKPGFGKIQTDFQSAQKVNKGHGRLEIRTIHTSEMLNSYSDWPGLAQVYRLEREIQWWRAGQCCRISSELEFGITSLSRKKTSPLQLLDIRRAHWGIETGLHYRRDVTLKEDAIRMTVGSTGVVMASINNLVLALIQLAKFYNAAQARRWFAANFSRAFILLTSPSLLL